MAQLAVKAWFEVSFESQELDFPVREFADKLPKA